MNYLERIESSYDRLWDNYTEEVEEKQAKCECMDCQNEVKYYMVENDGSYTYLCGTCYSAEEDFMNFFKPII